MIDEAAGFLLNRCIGSHSEREECDVRSGRDDGNICYLRSISGDRLPSSNITYVERAHIGTEGDAGIFNLRRSNSTNQLP